jgi:hypothetical protein
MIGIFNNFIQLCFDLFILAWNYFSIPFLNLVLLVVLFIFYLLVLFVIAAIIIDFNKRE